MVTPARRPYPESHPVLDDEALQERVLDIMWRRIQKTVSPTIPPRRRTASTANLQLAGGIRADEVLNEAFAAVLYFEPSKLTGTWEGLATAIAHNKAVEAVRQNTKARKRGEKEIDLVSLDREDPEGRSLADALEDELSDPEGEAIALGQERILQRLAVDLLSDRDRDIYYRRHYLWQTRAAIAEIHGLTEAGVGYVYIAAARKLLQAARQDAEFQRLSNPDGGGNR
ncbi:MAG: hypothetical protein M3277_12475 [Actinomycetota bacterium]|nr:hypothetical protein [Actinomycetota bacterium]